MVKFKIYIEGGGEGEGLDSAFREGWKRFFLAAGLSRQSPGVVRGGGRDQTFKKFKIAIMNPIPGEIPLLLVDSEGPVAANLSIWTHLKTAWKWDHPDSARDDQAFLMIEVMETWFLADREMLRSYFGQEFIGRHLKDWPTLEKVPKATVLKALRLATAACPRPYSKGKVSFELLGRLDPSKVAAACPQARALLDRLTRT